MTLSVEWGRLSEALRVSRGLASLFSDDRGHRDGSLGELLAGALTKMPHVIMPRNREMALGPEGTLQLPRSSPIQAMYAYKLPGQKWRYFKDMLVSLPQAIRLLG